MGLIVDMLAGDDRALSKLITLVENNSELRSEIINQIHKYTGKSHIIGFTGPPGVGKSTLVNQVIAEMLNRGKSVGVIAIDPSSPFTKGAILGDRIRMLGNEDNKNLFIRSLASRGKLGGLSQVTNDVVKLLDAYGKDVILIETVGIGQSEYDIAKTAHTTNIVLSPGYGDDIQAMKAGILEVGDVFTVNKADMDEDSLRRILINLRGTVQINFGEKEWKPQIIKTIAPKKVGITELVDEFENHYKYLINSNEWELKTKARIESELYDELINWLENNLVNALEKSEYKSEFLSRIYNKENTPEKIIIEFINQQFNNNTV